MKKIINGRRYDTDAAKLIAEASSDALRTDFRYWEETLYRKNTGEFFLHGVGGPMSQYAAPSGNGWTGGAKIIPLSLEEAQAWAEKNMGADEYEATFGAVEEDESKRTVTFSLTEKSIEKIARLAVEWNCAKSEVVERLVSEK